MIKLSFSVDATHVKISISSPPELEFNTPWLSQIRRWMGELPPTDVKSKIDEIVAQMPLNGPALMLPLAVAKRLNDPNVMGAFYHAINETHKKIQKEADQLNRECKELESQLTAQYESASQRHEARS